MADIRLQPEQVVRVRLVDVSGAPARGVAVIVSGIGRINDKGKYDGVSLGTSKPAGIRVWPRPVKTDDQGRIALSGIGRGAQVSLRVSDLRYARQDLYVDPAKASATKEITIALEPGRIIEGRVLAADTGQPIPNAIVSASALVMNEHARGYFIAKFRADEQGRFAMNPTAAESYTLGAFPTGGEPYLIQQDEFEWTKGHGQGHPRHQGPPRRPDPRQGDRGSDRSPAARVEHHVHPCPWRRSRCFRAGRPSSPARTTARSRSPYRPARGTCLSSARPATSSSSEIGSNRLYYDRPGGQRYRGHAVIPYEVKAGDPPHEVAVALRPGVTIKGRVEGPDGQTVTDGFILTTLRIEPFNPFWRGDFQVPIRDGRFELHGLAPEGSTRISRSRSRASVGRVGRDLRQAIRRGPDIRLQPCGQAKARFLGPDGHPVAKKRPHLEIVDHARPKAYDRKRADPRAGRADGRRALVANVDRKHYWNLPGTDADGRITLISLIPGALYRITDLSPAGDDKKGIQIQKDFAVKPARPSTWAIS